MRNILCLPNNPVVNHRLLLLLSHSAKRCLEEILHRESSINQTRARSWWMYDLSITSCWLKYAMSYLRYLNWYRASQSTILNNLIAALSTTLDDIDGGDDAEDDDWSVAGFILIAYHLIRRSSHSEFFPGFCVVLLIWIVIGFITGASSPPIIMMQFIFNKSYMHILAPPCEGFIKINGSWGILTYICLKSKVNLHHHHLQTCARNHSSPPMRMVSSWLPLTTHSQHPAAARRY